MNSINPRFLSILAGTLCMSALWTSCAYFGSKSEHCIYSLELKRKEAEERLKQEKMYAYRQEAMGLLNAICDKYAEGTLHSGVDIAKVGSINLMVVDPEMPQPEKDYSDLDRASLFDDIKYAEWKKKVTEYGERMHIWNRAQSFKNNPWIGATTVSTRYTNKLDVAAIYVNSENNILSSPYRTQVMLHEIAHVFDECSRKPEDEKSDCYKWLQSDIKNHPDREKIDLGEWHAEKQSVEWMKALYPDDAKALKKEFKQDVASRRERALVPAYPPIAKLVEWLSTYNPLRMKEIKKLGLLWNM